MQTHTKLLTVLFSTALAFAAIGCSKPATEADILAKLQEGANLYSGNAEADVEQNLEAAAKAFKQAAKMGSPEAMLMLGGMYRSGEGVKEDQAKAFEYYTQAAQQENLTPQTEANVSIKLGIAYDRGLGVEEDNAKALELYQKAAQGGEVAAMHNIGVMYAQGDGVEKNERQAAEAFFLAARAGNPQSQYNLGVMFAQGLGVEQNEQEAINWLREAARRGHPGALQALGIQPQQ